MTSTRGSKSSLLRATFPWFISAFVCGCSNDAKTEWQALETSAHNEAKAGRSVEAEKDFQLAIKKADELQNNELIVTSLLALSDFYHEAGKSEMCFSLLTRAHALGEKRLKELANGGDQRPLWRNLTARCALARANAFREQGKYFESQPLYERAAELVSNGSVSTQGDAVTTAEATTAGSNSNTIDTNANTIEANATTGNTNPNTRGATTTAGDTKVSGTTISDFELLATIKKEVALMEEYRRKSDGVLDEMMFPRTPPPKTGNFIDRESFDGKWKEYVGLELKGRSVVNEKKLIDRVAEAKSLFGTHESRYREAIIKLYFYYLYGWELNKAQEIIDTDIKEFKSAENLTRAALETDPEKVNDAQILAGDLNLLGELYSRKGLHYTAIKARERALTLRERWGPETFEFVVMRRSLADAYVNVHNYPAAIEQLDKALTLNEQVRKTVPVNRQMPSNRYLILSSMSTIEQIEGSFKEAARHLKEARSALDIKPSDPNLYPDYLMKSAELAGAIGQFKQSREDVEAAVDYWKKHSTENSVFPLTIYLQAGKFYYTNHDYVNSIKLLKSAEEIIKNNPKLGSRNFYYIDVLHWLALATASTGNLDVALNYLNDAKAVVVEEDILASGVLAQVASNRANMTRRAGRCVEAQRLYKIAEFLSNKIPTENPDCRWGILFNQTVNETELNNLATARSVGAKTLKLAKASQFRSDMVGQSLCLLAWIDIMEGNTTSAQKYLDEAEQMCASALVPHNDILANIHVNRARIWFVRKQDSKVSKELDKAHQFYQMKNTNFDNLLYEWELENCLRYNRRPAATTAISQEKLIQIVDHTATTNRAFQPACYVRFGAAVLAWTGRTAEARQLEEIACRMRDDELTRRKVH